MTVLIAHVLCAVIGFGSVIVTGIEAIRAKGGPNVSGAEAVRRYFRPGVNWAGRVLYAVPVLGFLLISMSHGAYSTSDGWVVAGLLLWLGAAVLGELVLWPGERALQQIVTDHWSGTPARDVDQVCNRVAASSLAMGVCFVAAVVLMTGKP
ncbi:MAG TPA: DUF2269 family protein [Acidimicrobiales bacterium]|nr:DUF2269 family protein [Acidimicrobiales bacterium]